MQGMSLSSSGITHTITNTISSSASTAERNEVQHDYRRTWGFSSQASEQRFCFSNAPALSYWAFVSPQLVPSFYPNLPTLSSSNPLFGCNYIELCFPYLPPRLFKKCLLEYWIDFLRSKLPWLLSLMVHLTSLSISQSVKNGLPSIW